MNQIQINNSLINIKEPILTIKELLNKLNYEYNDIFIDKFWQNIKDDIWLYIDEDMLKYIGYIRSENKKNKQDYLNLLKENFEYNIDYKLMFSKEFHDFSKCHNLTLRNNIKNEHNKVKHLIVSPDCFKQSLMLLKTKKSKEIKKYYIELEKIFKFYLEYQNEYRKKELTNIQKTLENTIINTKLDNHKYLIEKFKFKQCIYVIEVNINDLNLIKIGSTKNINERILAMNSAYSCKCVLLDIYECETNFREIEQFILSNKEVKENLYKEPINNITPKEIVKLSNIFNYNQLIDIIKQAIKNNVYLTPVQLLEKQKMDLVNRLLDNGYNPNLFENFTINIITRNEMNINHKNSTCIECNKIISNLEQENKLDNIIKDFYKIKNENNNNELNENINEEINNENELLESIEKENDIPFKIKNSRGRKIQKINPNNLDVVVKVYNSMIYLLRSNEGVKYLKSGVQDAIKNNTIYKGFRWCFVENGEDPYISKAGPTNNISSRITEPIVKIDETKTKIIDIYKNQEECFLNNGLTKTKLKDLIKKQELYYNVYFMKVSDCNSDILEKYNIKNDIFKKQTKSKSIIAINPLTKEEMIFKTITEIPIKLGGTESSVNSAIQNKNIYNGYYWKLKE